MLSAPYTLARMATVPAASPIPASLARTIIAHNRLEPRPRSHEFSRSLRAEIRDAAWLLGRQWQLKEFRAEDRGSPAFTNVELRVAQPTRLQLAGNPGQEYDPNLPWEAQTQAQTTAVDSGLRLRMGLAWLRLLREKGLSRFADVFRNRYPLAAVAEPANGEFSVAFAQAQTTPEIQAVLRDSGARAVDGYALFEAVRENNNVAATLVGSAADAPAQATLTQLAIAFLDSYQRLYFGRPASSAWSVPDLSYQYALAVPDTTAPTILAGREHSGGSAQWHSVDQAELTAYPALAGASITAKNATLRVIPTEIEFTGAPASRWWAFEDHRVDFGQVTGDSSDFGRMLLQEFVFLYQNDWFSVPCTVPVGSLTTVTGVVVTDVFGQRHRVHAAGASTLTEANGSLIDDDQGRWSMFGLSQVGERTAEPPRMLVPHAALTPLVGKPVEQVKFFREEATNLVWAVEQTIPNGFGGGTDGAGAAARVAEYLRTRATPLPSTTPAYTYRLASSVPEHWIPFISRPDVAGVSYLEQGELPRQVDGLTLQPQDQTVQPRTNLLQLQAGQPYLIHEYHVPPSGVQIDGTYRRARSLDGSIALWYEYQRQPARRTGGSGLHFDQLMPGSNATASTGDAVGGGGVVAPNTPYAQNQLFNATQYDQYMVVPLPALDALSISFWVNVEDDDFGSNWHYLLDGRNLRNDTWFASFGIGSDWTWYLDGVQNGNSALSGVLPLRGWHHLVLITGATQAGELLINARYTQNEYTRSIRFADLRIYGRPLLPAEIASSASTLNDAGLVARFNFAQSPRISATTLQATDNSGNGNHGTLQGF